MEVIEISRQVMKHLDAFEGCKPVVHNNEAMLIRGKTQTKFKPEEIMPKLEEVYDQLNIKKVGVNSQKARTITDQVDATFRRTTEVYDESNGLAGIERIKHSFEISGFIAEYIIGQVEDIGVYVVMYMDKSGVGPIFVETMVVKLYPLEDDD